MNEFDLAKKRIEVLEKELCDSTMAEVTRIEQIEKLQAKLSNAINVGAIMIARYEKVSKPESVALMLSRIGGRE